MGLFAQRLFQVSTNSVFSERSFFVMNSISTKLQNRFISERVNKLQYIYINQQTLKKIGIQEPSNLELIEVEDNWGEKSQNTAEGGDDGEVENSKISHE